MSWEHKQSKLSNTDCLILKYTLILECSKGKPVYQQKAEPQQKEHGNKFTVSIPQTNCSSGKHETVAEVTGSSKRGLQVQHAISKIENYNK